MSADILLKVMTGYAERKGAELWLALVMSAEAGADGTRICATVGSLAKRLQMSERSIQYHLRRMEKSNFLIKTNAGDGRNGQPTRYRISPSWIRETPSAKGAQANCAAEAAVSGAPPMTGVGANSCKGVGANKDKNAFAPTGAISAKCSKNEQNFLHPQYIVNSIYKLNEEGNNTLAPAKALRPDWKLPARFGNWALETFPTWTRELVLHFAQKFKTYWVPTGKAKADWFPTWCKFCEQEAEYLARHALRHPLAAIAAPAGSAMRLQAHPGETMEAFVRRQHMAAEAIAANPDVQRLPTPSAAASTAQQRDPIPERTSERLALIRESLARAKEAARQGVVRHNERMAACMQMTVPPKRPGERHAALSDADKGLVIPRAENASAELAGGINPPDDVQPVVAADASKSDANLQAKRASRRQQSLHADALRKPGGCQTRKLPPVLRQRRALVVHARASPIANGNPRISKLHVGMALSHPPWERVSDNYPVRTRYLLPDSTAQWR